MDAVDTYLFIHDSKCMQEEEDDPIKAIRYFYPVNYDKNKQCALCGSIVGMCNTIWQLTSSFPRTVTLRTLKFNVIKEEEIIIAMGVQKADFCGQEKKLLDLVDIIVLRFSSVSIMLQQWHSLKIIDDMIEIVKRIQPLKNFEVSYDIQMKTILLMENFSKHASVYGLSLFYDKKVLHSTIDNNLTLKLYICKMFTTNAEFTVHTQQSTVRHFPVYIARKMLDQLRFFNSIKVRKEHSLQQKAKTKRERSLHEYADSSSDSLEGRPVIAETVTMGEDQDLVKIELVIIQIKQLYLLILHNCESLDLERYQKWEKAILQIDEELESKLNNCHEKFDE